MSEFPQTYLIMDGVYLIMDGVYLIMDGVNLTMLNDWLRDNCDHVDASYNL